MTNWIENKVFIKHQNEDLINQFLIKLKNTTDNDDYSFFCSSFLPHPNENYYGNNPIRGWQIEEEIIFKVFEIMEKNNIKQGSSVTPIELQKKLMEELSCSTSSWGDINWGCKFEHRFRQKDIELINKNEILVKNFKTAWTSPILVYQKMIESGYEITGYYNDKTNYIAGVFEGNDVSQQQLYNLDYTKKESEESEIKIRFLEFLRGD